MTGCTVFVGASATSLDVVGDLLRRLLRCHLHCGGLKLLTMYGIVCIFDTKPNIGSGHSGKRGVLKLFAEVEVRKYLLHRLSLLLQFLNMLLELLLFQGALLFTLLSRGISFQLVDSLVCIYRYAHFKGLFFIQRIVIGDCLCERIVIDVLRIKAMLDRQRLQRRIELTQRFLSTLCSLQSGLNSSLHLLVVLRVCHDLLPGHTRGSIGLIFFRGVLSSGGLLLVLLRLLALLLCSRLCGRSVHLIRPIFSDLVCRNTQFQQPLVTGGITIFARCGTFSTAISGTLTGKQLQFEPFFFKHE